MQPDTREQAASFAANHLPATDQYLSEVYDLGITPFNPYFPHLTLFNFYDLETSSPDASPTQLAALLETTNAIILPSPRILNTRLRDAKRFPLGHAFYQALTDQTGYQKIYETPCDVFCEITYLGNPTSEYEDTAAVFDRPVVRIYKKR